MERVGVAAVTMVLDLSMTYYVLNHKIYYARTVQEAMIPVNVLDMTLL